jgi:hypothetical protein
MLSFRVHVQKKRAVSMEWHATFIISVQCVLTFCSVWNDRHPHVQSVHASPRQVERKGRVLGFIVFTRLYIQVLSILPNKGIDILLDLDTPGYNTACTISVDLCAPKSVLADGSYFYFYQVTEVS